MSSVEKIIYFLLNIGLLSIFFLCGKKLLTPELFFEYHKTFAFAALLFILAEVIKLHIVQRLTRKVRAFLENIAFSEAREIQEVTSHNPLFPYYKTLLRILQKNTSVYKGKTNLQYEDIISTLYAAGSTRQKIKLALQKIHQYLPNSELYVLFINDNSIELLEQYGSEEAERVQKLIDSNHPLPFNIKSEFSGLVCQKRDFMISNDLKSDPNLGQFLSDKNPNIPIYGALFPIGQKTNCCGLLWIRDGASALDFVKENYTYFNFFCTVLQQELFLENGCLWLSKKMEEGLFWHFEQRASWLLELAKVEKRVFATFIIYFRGDENLITDCIQSTKQIIAENLPIPACFSRRGNLIYAALNTTEAMVTTVHVSAIFDGCIRLLSARQDNNVFGINMGVSITEADDELDSLAESLHNCQEALRKAISQEENCLRIM